MSKIQLDTPMVNEIRSTHWRRRPRCRPRPCPCSSVSLSPFSCSLPVHRRATFGQQGRMASSKKPWIDAVADEAAQAPEIFQLHHAVPGEHFLQPRVGEIECLGQRRHLSRLRARHVQLGDAVRDAVLEVCCISLGELSGRQALLAAPLDEGLPAEFERVERELARDVTRVRHPAPAWLRRWQPRGARCEG